MKHLEPVRVAIRTPDGCFDSVRHPDINFTVYGHGSIGDKAGKLLEETAFYRSVGFYTPSRHAIAQGILNKFVQHSGFGRDLSDAVARGVTPEDVLLSSSEPLLAAALSMIVDEHGRMPMMVRSSEAKGAYGTGIYWSGPAMCTKRQLLDAVKKVIASFFTAAAVAFRKDAATGDGFGVLVEPLVCNHFGKLYAPPLSGFGYSDDAYVVLVPGLGGAVEKGWGEKITADQIAGFGGDLDLYMSFRTKDHWRTAVPKESALTLGYVKIDHAYEGLAFKPRKRKPVKRAVLSIHHLLRSAYLPSLFASMRGPQGSDATRRYFEFALTFERSMQRLWLLQVADVEPGNDQLGFKLFGRPVIAAHTVKNSGIKWSRKLVVCWEKEDVEVLKRFNAENQGYVLVFAGELVSGFDDEDKIFTYDVWSNAAALIEVPTCDHRDDPIEHLGGQAKLTGKFFGVLEREAKYSPEWKAVKQAYIQRAGFFVREGFFRILSSKRENQMIVSEVSEDEWVG